MVQPATPEVEELPPCPLSTNQLIDLILTFVDLYNESSGIQLYSYQRLFIRRIIESLLLQDGNVLTGLLARQSGKSELIASAVGAVCVILPALAKLFPGDARLNSFLRGLWVGVFAPRLQQSGYIYQRIRERAEKDEAKEIYRDPDININLTQSRGDQVSWSNGSYVRSQTASEQSNVEGATYHLVILDESQLISRTKVQKEILPMLASTNGTCVKIGTAHLFRGGFHDSIVHNLAKEESGGPRNHFEFPYDVIIAQKRKKYEETVAAGRPNPIHLRYEAWVSGELDRLGGNVDNEEFKMNFRLLWKETSLGAVDREAFFNHCPEDRIEAGEVRQFRRQVAGLDLARINDYTVLTVVEMGDIIHYPGFIENARPGEAAPVFRENTIISWLQPDHGLWKHQIQEVVKHLGFFSVDTLVVDCTGVGDPVSEQLQDLLPGITVVGYNMNVVTKDSLYKRYLLEISTGRLRYAAGELTRESYEFKQFIKQHENLEKTYSGRYMCPRAPEGEQDDFCDSAALAIYATTLESVQHSDVESSANPLFSKVDNGYGYDRRSDRYRSRF